MIWQEMIYAMDKKDIMNGISRNSLVCCKSLCDNLLAAYEDDQNKKSYTTYKKVIYSYADEWIFLKMHEYDPIFYIRSGYTTGLDMMPYLDLSIKYIRSHFVSAKSYIESREELGGSFVNFENITKFMAKYLEGDSPGFYRRAIDAASIRLYKKLKNKDYTNTDEFNFIFQFGINWFLPLYLNHIEQIKHNFDQDKLNIDVWTLYQM